MTKLALKNKAQELRREGKSIKEIAKEINASVSSVSVWCRNIELAPEHIERLSQRRKEGTYRGILKSAEKKRKERLKKIEQLHGRGMRDVGGVSDRDFFIAGIALYWGEGFKTQDGSVGFSIGDPDMVKFLLAWMYKYLGCDNDDIRLRLTLNNKYKKQEQNIKEFWMNELEVSASQFHKTMYINSSNPKYYKANDSYKGTLRIILTGSTDKLRLVEGWIMGLKAKE